MTKNGGTTKGEYDTLHDYEFNFYLSVFRSIAARQELLEVMQTTRNIYYCSNKWKNQFF
jgi:hypothetical protein